MADTLSPGESLHAIRTLIEAGQIVTPEQKAEVRSLLDALATETSRLTVAEKDALSASVDTTLDATHYPEVSSFWALWPARTYFDAYRTMVEKAESPPVYHFFAAATALGACTGLRCWYPTWPDRVYPNMAVCFLGPTGMAKKSTATKPAIHAIEVLNRDREAVFIIFNKANPKSIIDALSKRDTADCLIWAPEFSAFLSKERTNEGFAPIFADLLDTHRKSGDLTIHAGQRMMHNTCVSVMAASNMDWLRTATPRETLTGGLMNRFVFIVQHVRYKRSTLADWMTQPEQGMHDAVVEHLQWANTLPTTAAEVADDAEEYYNGWYQAVRDDIDPMMGAYVERKHVHVLRLALILALADRRTTVLKSDMVDSIKIMGWVEAFIPIMLDAMLGSATDKAIDYVLRKFDRSIQTDPITGNKTVTKTRITRDSHWPPTKVTRVLKSMVQQGLIRQCGKPIPETYVIIKTE